jgi:hypothetical protein
MKHPSEYTTIPLYGFHVMIVDEGTTITDEASGEEALINGEEMVFKGTLIYCTQPIYEALVAEIDRRKN